jgi:hypothetical protein
MTNDEHTISEAPNDSRVSAPVWGMEQSRIEHPEWSEWAFSDIDHRTRGATVRKRERTNQSRIQNRGSSIQNGNAR